MNWRDQTENKVRDVTCWEGNYEAEQDTEVGKGATGRKMWWGGSIRRDMTERFYGACAGALCLTENPGRKFFLADEIGRFGRYIR